MLDYYYNRAASNYSDIHLHIPRLKALAENCESVIEFGTANVTSTWALASARPKKLTCVDVSRTENVDILEKTCADNNIDFDFVLENTLKVTIDEVDMIFIDTFHSYSQLKQELLLHGNKAKKYLAFHDTETFGRRSEDGDTEKGLLNAIEEFIKDNPHWKVKKIYTDNNGLTILERSSGKNINLKQEKPSFCIATFCCFERYRKVAINKLIKSTMGSNIPVIIITDRPSDFDIFPHVQAYNINEFQDSRLLIHSYFDFDFSIKRFALKKAYEKGYNKILLCDVDTVIDDIDNFKRATKNLPAGNGIYSASANYQVDFDRFVRLKFYLDYFNMDTSKFLKEVPVISEDLQQVFCFPDGETFTEFMDTWDELEDIKKENKLDMRMVGVLEEIAFAAYKNNIPHIHTVSLELKLRAEHDKWYNGERVNDVNIVSCVYGKNEIFNGHTNKDLHYIASLSSTIKHMKACYTIYHSYFDINSFNDSFSGVKLKERELNDYFFAKKARSLPAKNIYDKTYRNRSLYVQWGKFCMLNSELHGLLEHERIYWIDAGLASPGLFPPKYNPNMNPNDKFHYNDKNIYKNHDFSKLLNTEMLKNMKSEDKVVVICERNVPPEDGLIAGTPPNMSRVIGGFFGGPLSKMRVFVSLFLDKLDSLLDAGECYTEEAIMTYIVGNHPDLFAIKYFDCWHYENSDHGTCPKDAKSFFEVFEEYLNGEPNE